MVKRIVMEFPNDAPINAIRSQIHFLTGGNVDFIGESCLALEEGYEGEVRHIDPTTGAQKGTKLARYDLVPTLPLKLLAEHYGKGAVKYEANNWRKGIDWSKLYAALQRHLQAFWSGEDFDNDPAMGSDIGQDPPLHLVAALWQIVALVDSYHSHPEKDDRFEAQDGQRK